MLAPPFGPPDLVRRAGSLHDSPLIGGTECLGEAGQRGLDEPRFEDDPYGRLAVAIEFPGHSQRLHRRCDTAGLCLARGGAADRRFEVLGADLGRAFALSHDMGERRAETVGDSIALHTIASIAQHKGADVACCQIGIACDYGGLGYDELSDDNRKAILSTFPRLGMKNELTTCLCGIAKNHPNTTRDNFIADFGLKYVPGYMRASSVDFLQKSPFAE